MGGDHAGMDHSNHDHDHHSNQDPLDYTAAKADHSHHSTGHEGHGMADSFYAGCNAKILFSSWVTSTWAQMFGSCVVVFIAAALYEGLKAVRERLLEKEKKREKQMRCSVIPSDENQIDVTVNRSAVSQMCSGAHFIQVLLHIIQVGSSYLLMLVAMTYNVWLCLAVVLGAGLGFFLFGWRRTRTADRNEHCH